MLLRAIAIAVLFVAAGVASAAGGELDPSFSGDGWVRTTEVQSGAEHYILSGVDDLAIQADGRLLVTGEVHSETTGWNFGVFRYLQDGSLDGSLAGSTARSHGTGG